MKVLKFGGASIKDISSIKNTVQIIKNYKHDNLIVVFSAMGKVTNMFEDLYNFHVQAQDEKNIIFNKIKCFHYDILNSIFDQKNLIYDEIHNIFIELEWALNEDSTHDYSYTYDQIISAGEFLSTKIMSFYLNDIGVSNKLIDARDIIRTDNTYQNAQVNWKLTTELIKKEINKGVYITQGFVGGTSENHTTTLGREGSDFSAAILAFSLKAKEVIIWKDVLGLMSADPKYFPNAQLYHHISYDEAIELAFFGAKVVHPKTIQPLKKKNIPLIIRSFIDLDNSGTLVYDGQKECSYKPSYILKKDQILISISDPDLSFIIEQHLSKIFKLLATYSITPNLMQNSAISFSICIDNHQYKVPCLISDLQKYFKVNYNSNLTLYTIRHYTLESLKLFNDKKIILEQKSRNTIQVVAE